jgi:protein phosphatase/serine/threonine-protein phosphatase Stp1
VVLLARDDYFACLWAGDSRAYLLRGGRFRQLTRDHSLVQELFDAGAISAREAIHHPPPTSSPTPSAPTCWSSTR